MALSQFSLRQLWDSARFWRGAAATAAALALAFLVAAAIARPRPDFSALPVVAVVRDDEQRPVWAIRLARRAHLIVADSLRPAAPPAGRVYQLWLSVAGDKAPHWLGLLPQSGRKPIAVTPENARLLRGAGRLVVTSEPEGGASKPEPSGPALFAGGLDGSG